MAEGLARHLKGESIEPYSAGVVAHGLDPRAVRAMAENGIDISLQRSKDMTEVMSVPFDYVITLCDNAREACPFFPGKARHMHMGFDDPPSLAKNAKTEEEALIHYSRVRDEIRGFVEKLPDILNTL